MSLLVVSEAFTTVPFKLLSSCYGQVTAFTLISKKIVIIFLIIFLCAVAPSFFEFALTLSSQKIFEHSDF